MKRLLVCLAGLMASVPSGLSAQVASRTVQSASASTGVIVKDSSGQLTALNVVAGATPGFVLVLDAKVIPAPGAVVPLKCLPIAASAGVTMVFGSAPINVGNGVVVLFSSGANCFTYAASATAFISADVQ